MKMKKLFYSTLIAIISLPVFAAFAADEYRFEVLATSGKPSYINSNGSTKGLNLGDTLGAGDVIETGAGDTVTLSQDGEWKNTAFIESLSTAKIKSVLPAKIELSKGGVFAKLKNLPKNSSFNIQTPTAVASVRGTEYRVQFGGNDTQIFNFSESKVYVFSPGPDGEALGAPVELENSQKIEMVEGHEAPIPTLMSYEETSLGREMSTAIEAEIREAETSGRTAKIQKVEEMIVSSGSSSTGVTEEESRVTDTRRRAFKKV